MKKVAVVKEQFPGERRVALLPENVEKLIAAGYEVLVEEGAGEAAGIIDQNYADAGAAVTSRSQLTGADVLVQVRSLGANTVNGVEDLELLNAGQLVIGMCDPLGNAEAIAELAQAGVSQIALEMVPRITRAQSMDVLSSMATIAGYRAVLHAAYQLPRMFPLNMTAAGTLSAARVFIIGAGVAGLQAAATAKRLGAIVSAYDVRPDCREQVESVGARFVELELEAEDAEDAGGYAKEQTEDFLTRQRAFMAEVASEHDIIITTAAIPGRQSPLLLTSDAVHGMGHGSVIVDLAAERGGNCAETEADQTIVVDGVTIMGPTNLPSEIPYHASQMFGNNVTNLLLHLISEEGDIELDLEDDIVAGCLISKEGEIVNQRIGDLLGVAVETPEPPQESEEPEGSNEDESSEDEIVDRAEAMPEVEPVSEAIESEYLAESPEILQDQESPAEDLGDTYDAEPAGEKVEVSPAVDEEPLDDSIEEEDELVEYETEEDDEELAEETDEGYFEEDGESDEVEEVVEELQDNEEDAAELEEPEDGSGEVGEEDGETEEYVEYVEYEEDEEEDEEDAVELEEPEDGSGEVGEEDGETEEYVEYVEYEEDEEEDEEDAVELEEPEDGSGEVGEEDEETEEYVEYVEYEEEDEEEDEGEDEEDAAELEEPEDGSGEVGEEGGEADEYELEDYDAAEDYGDDEDPDFDFSDYEE